MTKKQAGLEKLRKVQATINTYFTDEYGARAADGLEARIEELNVHLADDEEIDFNYEIAQLLVTAVSGWE